MPIIQVNGLPGSGKTTGINVFLQETKNQIQVVDKRSFLNFSSYESYLLSIKSNQNIIAEASCTGFLIPSIIIVLDTPINEIIQNLRKRGDSLRIDELISMQALISVQPDFKVKSTKELCSVLKAITAGT